MFDAVLSYKAENWRRRIRATCLSTNGHESAPGSGAMMTIHDRAQFLAGTIGSARDRAIRTSSPSFVKLGQINAKIMRVQKFRPDHSRHRLAADGRDGAH